MSIAVGHVRDVVLGVLRGLYFCCCSVEGEARPRSPHSSSPVPSPGADTGKKAKANVAYASEVDRMYVLIVVLLLLVQDSAIRPVLAKSVCDVGWYNDGGLKKVSLELLSTIIMSKATVACCSVLLGESPLTFTLHRMTWCRFLCWMWSFSAH